MLYILLADGFEETEAIAPIDVLRRAGLDITLVGLSNELVTGAHNITFKSELLVNQVSKENLDGIILPGGMPGTTNLKNNTEVIELLNYCNENNKLIAAICAAPSIPGSLGMLSGKEATCFPGFENQLNGAALSDAGVVRDKNFITSKGAGTALDFGKEIVNYFIPNKGDEILAQMQYNV